MVQMIYFTHIPYSATFPLFITQHDRFTLTVMDAVYAEISLCTSVSTSVSGGGVIKCSRHPFLYRQDPMATFSLIQGL